MSELKTLKDFSDKECYCNFATAICPEKLRKRRFIPETLLKQEAIKCIDSNSIKHMNANDFILWFFNITEEDLK